MQILVCFLDGKVHFSTSMLQINFFFSLKKMSNTMLFIYIAYSKAVFANYTDCDDYSIHYFLLELGETKNK